MANGNTARNSLRSVAQAVGLSVTTVHQVLNNKSSSFISDETRKRVWRIANEMGYRPNIGYKLMRGEKTRIVAVMVSSEHLRRREPVAELLITLVDRLEKLGYVTYFSILQYSEESNLQKIRELLARGAEHFIMIGNPVGYEQLETEIAKARCTLVGLGEMLKRRITNGVICQQAEILNFFLKRGRRNIRCLSPESGVYSIYGRLDALKATFPAAAEQDLVERYIFAYPDSDLDDADIAEQDFQCGIRVTAELMKRHPETDAVFYPTDTMALGGAKVMFEHGIRVGRDVLLAGFYNIAAVRQYCMPISSIGYDLQALQEKLLLHAFDDGPCCEEVPTITYIRE